MSASIGKRVAIHVVILLFVVIAPPLIYDAISRSNAPNINGIEFVGGATYPAYILYWLSQIKNTRAKFMLVYLLALLLLPIVVLGLSSKSPPAIALAMPALMGVVPLLLAIVAMVRRNTRFAMTCVWTTLLTLPLGLCMSALFFYGAGMSAIGNLRY